MTLLLFLATLQAGLLSTGVAVTGTQGELCAAFPAPLAPGASVTLVRPEPPRSVVRAVVVERVDSCDRLEDARIESPYYRLGYRSTADADESELAVVFAGAPDPDLRVRSCSSSEGLHLTVWLGEPLKGRRVSRTYFYLGFDVEPDCEERDVRD